mmetsp:Transcript_101002/g.182274  ORF Transcript_101002/g.182274 Transcript_101002/m.182274 type:complete len:161 (+) Transcript_101002:214-696(+)
MSCCWTAMFTEDSGGTGSLKSALAGQSPDAVEAAGDTSRDNGERAPRPMWANKACRLLDLLAEDPVDMKLDERTGSRSGCSSGCAEAGESVAAGGRVTDCETAEMPLTTSESSWAVGQLPETGLVTTTGTSRLLLLTLSQPSLPGQLPAAVAGAKASTPL